MVSFVVAMNRVDVVDLVVDLVDLDLDVDLVDADLAVSLCDDPRSVLFKRLRLCRRPSTIILAASLSWLSEGNHDRLNTNIVSFLNSAECVCGCFCLRLCVGVTNT